MSVPTYISLVLSTVFIHQQAMKEKHDWLKAYFKSDILLPWHIAPAMKRLYRNTIQFPSATWQNTTQRAIDRLFQCQILQFKGKVTFHGDIYKRMQQLAGCLFLTRVREAVLRDGSCPFVAVNSQWRIWSKITANSNENGTKNMRYLLAEKVALEVESDPILDHSHPLFDLNDDMNDDMNDYPMNDSSPLILTPPKTSSSPKMTIFNSSNILHTFDKQTQTDKVRYQSVMPILLAHLSKQAECKSSLLRHTKRQVWQQARQLYEKWWQQQICPIARKELNLIQQGTESLYQFMDPLRLSNDFGEF